jgi:hypothetical protein
VASTSFNFAMGMFHQEQFQTESCEKKIIYVKDVKHWFTFPIWSLLTLKSATLFGITVQAL